MNFILTTILVMTQSTAHNVASLLPTPTNTPAYARSDASPDASALPTERCRRTRSGTTVCRPMAQPAE